MSSIERKRPWFSIGVFLLTIFLGLTATAEESSSVWNRKTLGGNWGGMRSSLEENGIRYNLSYTGFYQGLFEGDGNDDWRFGGRVDLLLDFDTGKLGLWDGGGIHTHIEYRGDSPVAFRGGALWPVNTGALTPIGAAHEFVASSLYLSQRTGEESNVIIGKINALDLLSSHPFFGGSGTDRFWNIAFTAPPSGVVPPVIIGGILSYSAAPYSFTIMVFDPNDQTTNYSLDNLFSDGVNVSFGINRSGSVAGRQSSIGFTATYSSADGIDYSKLALPLGSGTTTKKGSYNIAVELSHLLKENAQKPGKGIGLYLKGAIADGNPNPVQCSFIGGIGGIGLFPERIEDSFGIGYYYYNFSEKLQNAISPLVNFEDEQGIEVFYNFAATPWFHIALDLQYIDPASGDNKNALVGGLRTRIIF